MQVSAVKKDVKQMRYMKLYAFIIIICFTISMSGCIRISNGKKALVTESTSNTIEKSINNTGNIADANIQANVSKNEDNLSLELNMETEHFVFYCREQDKKCLDDLSNTLESNYDRITKDLKCKASNKITVEIYKDIDEVGRVTGLSCAGTAKNGKIQIASPYGAGIPDSLMKIIIVHEFTHIVVSYINRSLYLYPWLSEGIAEYEADGPPAADIRENMVSRMVSGGDIPTIDDLNTFIYKSDDLYACSYTIIEFIVKKYGYDKLIKLIKSPSEIKDIAGVTEDELYADWTDFLKKEYK